jgi:hypothetical protein
MLCGAAGAHENQVYRRYYDDGILKGFGTNIVIVGTPGQIIRITHWLDQISYHELAHAMHMMNGTWRYFASEAQAIEEENVFRRQMAEMQGQSVKQRYRIAGTLVNEPESDTLSSH